MLATLVFLCFQAFPALARGGEPRLEISSERMNPGGTIELSDVDFEFKEQISFALVGADIEIPLGEIYADTEGIFLQYITIPVDLREGVNYFVAFTDDYEILSPALTVQGLPIASEEGDGRESCNYEDGLIAPTPTLAPKIMSGSTSQGATQPAPEDATTSNPILLFLWS